MCRKFFKFCFVRFFRYRISQNLAVLSVVYMYSLSSPLRFIYVFSQQCYSARYHNTDRYATSGKLPIVQSYRWLLQRDLSLWQYHLLHYWLKKKKFDKTLFQINSLIIWELYTPLLSYYLHGMHTYIKTRTHALQIVMGYSIKYLERTQTHKGHQKTYERGTKCRKLLE